MMNYFPWIAGAAALVAASQTGRRNSGQKSSKYDLLIVKRSQRYKARIPNKMGPPVERSRTVIDYKASILRTLDSYGEAWVKRSNRAAMRAVSALVKSDTIVQTGRAKPFIGEGPFLRYEYTPKVT